MAFVFGAWGTWFYLTKEAWGVDAPGTERLAKFGQFGDTFGSLNTLFAGLAFTGVVFTIYRQQADGRDADARHRDSIKAEERIAAINGHTATLHYVENEVRRSDDRQLLISRIRAKLYNIPRRFYDPTAPFLSQAVALSDAEDFLFLVTQLVGEIAPDDTWGIVISEIQNSLERDGEKAMHHIADCRQMQEHAIQEIGVLTDQVKRETESA